MLTDLFLVGWLTQSLALLQCLKQYVELLIKEGLETAISCPDAACPKRGHLQENEVCFYCRQGFFFFSFQDVYMWLALYVTAAIVANICF